MADEEQSVEDMMKQVQLLELQAKRMEKLVAQRREERADMEAENARIQRQLKYMQEMADENDEAEEEYKRQQAAKAPFSGKGFTLGAPSPAPTTSKPASSAQVRKVEPAKVDTSKPNGNIQVWLVDGSRLVIKLNTVHTVADIKQEIMARLDLQNH